MNNPILRNVLAVVVGWVAGSIVNFGLIMISDSIIPMPDGVIPGDMKSLKENIHLFEGKHYIMPFLAHALGTLVGAIVAVKVGISKHLILAMIIGLLYFIGGLMVNYDLGITGTPKWVDLILAYFPFAFFGYKIGR